MLNRLVRVQASGFALGPERFEGAILFWEEAWAQTSVIWQELHVLRTAGIFERIAGMIVGAGWDLDFTPGGPDNLRDIVLDVLGDRDIPVHRKRRDRPLRARTSRCRSVSGRDGRRRADAGAASNPRLP